jgi:hypothetical protein
MAAPKNWKWGLLPLCAGLYVWLSPDERTPEALRALFHERGMELIRVEESTGCYRIDSFRYVARKRDGTVEQGLLCVNKMMRVTRLGPI